MVPTRWKQSLLQFLNKRDYHIHGDLEEEEECRVSAAESFVSHYGAKRHTKFNPLRIDNSKQSAKI